MLICWVDLTRPGLRLLGARSLGLPARGANIEEAPEMETLFPGPSVFDPMKKVWGHVFAQ